MVKHPSVSLYLLRSKMRHLPTDAKSSLSENDIFADECDNGVTTTGSISKRSLAPCRSTATNRNDSSDNAGVPSLSRLCLVKVRSLRFRLEGLAHLPEDIVKSIVEGSSPDELKQIETVNPEALKLKFWDNFWRTICEKTMVCISNIMECIC